MTPHTTRVAPSPTGDMHLGTARTAYFNWLAARASGGRFVLRIDDTDLARNDEKHVQDILDTMAWLGLDYDQLVRQSDRLARYAEVAQGLIDRGLAERADNGAALLRPGARDALPQSWVDGLSGTIAVSGKDLDLVEGLVLLKGDGGPTYNFATVVDDVDLGITTVIRGVDHVGNTSKQVALYHLLGAARPAFLHVGLLFQDGKKMSKRDKAGSVLVLRDAGYDPEAVLNFMLRLGWGPSVDDKSTAVLPRERALELFLTGGRMRNTPANVDPAKLDSFDRKFKARARAEVQAGGSPA